jgi:hypothetical protein
LLRDLHRPELLFDKVFVLVDPAEELRVDAVAEAASTMATSWRIASFDPLSSRHLATVLEDARRVRRVPWPSLFVERPLANRRIVE